MDRRKYFLTACALLLMLLSFAQNENIPTPQWRPVYHFTPEKNWTNDPNGPIYLAGEFHLYNQQNPFENNWGHMSWGHAKSRDLLHWKHLPVAIPERIDTEDTTWIFSGSLKPGSRKKQRPFFRAGLITAQSFCTTGTWKTGNRLWIYILTGMNWIRCCSLTMRKEITCTGSMKKLQTRLR